MRKKKNLEETTAEKIELFQEVEAGRISIGDATRKMRKIIGMTQKEYAEKIVGIYPRVLMQIENGQGNPRLDTLNKVAKPFGLKVGFVRERMKG